MSWTQPVCGKCFRKLYGQKPHRTRDAGKEYCCFCGSNTTEGIYIRANPNNVRFPRK